MKFAETRVFVVALELVVLKMLLILLWHIQVEYARYFIDSFDCRESRKFRLYLCPDYLLTWQLVILLCVMDSWYSFS